VLLLHDLQGLSSVEIARLLRCMPGSVKVRLHRARCRFRAALEKECHFYRDERGVLLGCPKSHTGERAT
jgi:DNA-directed RNA polymerase specialized sigma24 family protein